MAHPQRMLRAERRTLAFLITGVMSTSSRAHLEVGRSLQIQSLQARHPTLSRKESLSAPAAEASFATGSSEEVEERLAFLRGKGAMSYTSVVSAPSTASLGMRYAALCAACTQGEEVRDGGGHALVVLDDISCMVSF